MDFITANLPPAPARVLDAGCGDGRLADRLRAVGYTVTAIDVDPARARPGVLVADICGFRDPEDEPYDAVVCSLSLHHVEDLSCALDSLAGLLARGGRLIVDEFAHEQAGGAIADRYFGAAGSLPLWRDKHRSFHTGDAMVEAVARRFSIASLARVPYLYRYLEDASLREAESVLGLQFVADRRQEPS
ncbi:class I SAM-dependent methyltransferase [Jiangella mangrovi]|uniref:SAM-dependent methyltransferase n=1 Tax=Jiangella mangrovi TaxID=1524084 RepID=A0A7W9GSG3_9ACTN|nr:class I SAM-dependent methyltransferase [Jiangella mangrovi]MBB5788896.1 SAM-dependent methyltransferase [Jiangella mangrovi]